MLDLAAGTGSGPEKGQHTGVIWTSRDGLTWQRSTAAQLGLADLQLAMGNFVEAERITVSDVQADPEETATSFMAIIRASRRSAIL